MSKILIEHGWVIPMDGKTPVIEDGVVAIEENRIVSVGERSTINKEAGRKIQKPLRQSVVISITFRARMKH